MTALIAVSMNAQVGINTESPNANTALDVVSPRNNQGIMIPRMTEAQRNAISTSAADNSLMVYNTDEDCFIIIPNQTANGKAFAAAWQKPYLNQVRTVRSMWFTELTSKIRRWTTAII